MKLTEAASSRVVKKHPPPVDQWHQDQRGVESLHTGTSTATASSTRDSITGAGRKKDGFKCLEVGWGAGLAVQEIWVDLVIGVCNHRSMLTCAFVQITNFFLEATNVLGEAQGLANRYGQERKSTDYRIVEVTRKDTYKC